MPRPFLLALAPVAAVLFAAIGPAPVHAQSCDLQVLSATWSPHPDPDSIYVVFRVDMTTDMPISSDPLNPSTFDMDVLITCNGAPLGDDHPLTLAWSQRNNVCTSSCPHVDCEIKSWIYKGVQWIDRSQCILDAQNHCGCPPLGTPVPHAKAVPKPPAPGLIEVEILPLNLQGCNPINPSNDFKQFSYPGGTGGVPGLSSASLLLLAGALGLMALLVLRRRRAAASV